MIFALLDLEPYLDSQSGSNRQWLSRCYGKAWPSHLHQERSRDCNVSAGNRTRVSTMGGEHSSYSVSVLITLRNIYIQYDPATISVGTTRLVGSGSGLNRSGSTKLIYCLRRKICSHPILFITFLSKISWNFLNVTIIYHPSALLANILCFFKCWGSVLIYSGFISDLWSSLKSFWIWPWKIGDQRRMNRSQDKSKIALAILFCLLSSPVSDPTNPKLVVTVPDPLIWFICWHLSSLHRDLQIFWRAC